MREMDVIHMRMREMDVIHMRMREMDVSTMVIIAFYLVSRVSPPDAGQRPFFTNEKSTNTTQQPRTLLSTQCIIKDIIRFTI